MARVSVDDPSRCVWDGMEQAWKLRYLFKWYMLEMFAEASYAMPCLSHIYHSVIIFVASLIFARAESWCVLAWGSKIGWGSKALEQCTSFYPLPWSTNNHFTFFAFIVCLSYSSKAASAASAAYRWCWLSLLRRAHVPALPSLSIFAQNEGIKMCDHVSSISRSPGFLSMATYFYDGWGSKAVSIKSCLGRCLSGCACMKCSRTT